MVHRLVLPERTLPRRFVATNGAGSSVTGSPQRDSTPQPIIHLGQSRCNEGIKNRVTITSAVSARDTADKYSRANKVYFCREGRSVSVTYAKIPPLST